MTGVSRRSIQRNLLSLPTASIGERSRREDRLGSISEGRTVAVRACSVVTILQALHEEGARLHRRTSSGKRERAAKRDFGAESWIPTRFTMWSDIFSPCAWGPSSMTKPPPRAGGTVRPTISWKEERHGDRLEELKSSTPDYVINAGGLINVADECSVQSRTGDESGGNHLR